MNSVFHTAPRISRRVTDRRDPHPVTSNSDLFPDDRQTRGDAHATTR